MALHNLQKILQKKNKCDKIQKTQCTHGEMAERLKANAC